MEPQNKQNAQSPENDLVKLRRVYQDFTNFHPLLKQVLRIIRVQGILPLDLLLQGLLLQGLLLQGPLPLGLLTEDLLGFARLETLDHLVEELIYLHLHVYNSLNDLSLKVRKLYEESLLL